MLVTAYPDGFLFFGVSMGAAATLLALEAPLLAAAGSTGPSFPFGAAVNEGFSSGFGSSSSPSSSSSSPSADSSGSAFKKMN